MKHCVFLKSILWSVQIGLWPTTRRLLEGKQIWKGNLKNICNISLSLVNNKCLRRGMKCERKKKSGKKMREKGGRDWQRQRRNLVVTCSVWAKLCTTAYRHFCKTAGCGDTWWGVVLTYKSWAEKEKKPINVTVVTHSGVWEGMKWKHFLKNTFGKWRERSQQLSFRCSLFWK